MGWFSKYNPPEIGDSSLVIDGLDRAILKNVRMMLNNGYTVRFQFPPKIKSESNQSEWQATENMMASEPIRIHMGSGGRNLDVEWEYIASDPTWDAPTISKTIRNLKSYFFEFPYKNVKEDNYQYPIVWFRYTEIVPEPTPFRIMQVSVTYSDEIINNNGFHPLYTKVTARLMLSTNLNNIQEIENPKVDVPPLQDARYEWY